MTTKLEILGLTPDAMSSYIQNIVLEKIAEQSHVGDHNNITLDEELDFDLFLSSMDIQMIIELVEAQLEREIKYDVENLPFTVGELVKLCAGT